MRDTPFGFRLLASVALLGAGTAHAQTIKTPPPKAASPSPSGAATPAHGAAPTAVNTPPAAPKYRPQVPVLTLASEDAEDQAEALSGALRSRLREKPGVVVDETTMNLTTLIAALGCNGERPDPLCLIKIGEQLKVGRFLWGTTKKGPERDLVTSEVHLWRRGKADTVASESYAQNLRDQNDDVLRRIAGRLVDKLMGEPLAAAVTVRAGDMSGAIIVDGKDRLSLDRGETTVELKPGRHVIEVRVPGFRSSVQSVDVVASTDQVLNVRLAPEEAEKAPEPSKPISARTIVALSLIGVGAGFGVAGTVKATQFLSIRRENKRDSETIDATDFCDPSRPHKADLASMADACDRIKRGEDALKLQLVLYGVATLAAGAGLVLLITDTPDDEKSTSTSHIAPRVIPTVHQRGGGLDVSWRF